MYPKKIRPTTALFLLLCASSAAWGDPSAAEPVFKTDDTSGLLRGITDTIGDRRGQMELNDGLRRKSGTQEGEVLPDVGDDDLKKNPELANHILNTAMLREDWETLEHIMVFYRDIPGHDPVLYRFVQGALLRAQGKQGKAVRLYRDILREQPDLSYVRLDLAGMLFENRAYRDAAKEFARVKTEDIEPEAREQADAYLQAISQTNPWQLRLRGGWQYSNNINNATSNDFFLWPFLVIDGKTYYYKLPREAESMPRSGRGFSYGAQLQKDFNLKGNHNLGFSLDAEGTHYPGSRVDDDASVSVDGGYRFQNIDSTFSVSPLAGMSWQGGQPYSRHTGLNVGASRWLTPRLQLSANYSLLRKKYRDERYAGYDSTTNGVAVSSLYALTGNWFVFGGLGLQHEKTADPEEVSNRLSFHLGTLYRFDNGTNIRLGGRHVSRRFKNPAQLYGGDIRHDKEMYADFSLWKEKWLPGGITPKLEFNYLKVKSNIYAFPRNKRQISLILEKEF